VNLLTKQQLQKLDLKITVFSLNWKIFFINLLWVFVIMFYGIDLSFL